jgi:NAD+ kinase
MKKIALYENASKPEAIKWAEFAANKLRDMGAECCASSELIGRFDPESRKAVKALHPEEFDKFADVVISFGGDGTILSASHVMINTDTPIMGVNVGKLGFLAEFSVNNLEKSLDDMLKGNYRVVDRFAIETELNGEKLYALNDFVIEKRHSSRMITVQAYSDEHHVADYRADGLIITTPTGSTAYSLSCGGPVIAPSARVICLTPISPHALTLRPLVIPDTNDITIRLFSPTGEATLVADGNIERVITNDVNVVFRRSDAIVKLIKPQKSSYYDLLRVKLLWAANVVQDKPTSGGEKL